MKKTIFILVFMMLMVYSFGYMHIFSYQDFKDYEIGQEVITAVIPSNDDGTHGINDRWGDNNEFTWPDVPGDTDMYFVSDKPLKILEKDGEEVLYMDCEEGLKTTLGLKNVPNPPEVHLKIFYDFYLDTREKEDYSFVMYSTDIPGRIGRLWIVYTDKTIKVYRQTSRYSKTELYTKKIDLTNKWRRFIIEIKYGKVYRLIVDDSLITTFENNKYIETIPYYFIGNWDDKNQYSSFNLYLKTFAVAHKR